MRGALALVLTLGVLTPAVVVRTQERRPAPPTFILRGIVVDAESGEAVRRVRVHAVGEGKHVFGADTDADGRFVIDTDTPGKYLVSAHKAGYLFTNYGQVRDRGVGLPVSVPGHKGVLRIPISRGGVISGRVLDETSEPAVGVQVQAMRFTYTANGRQLAPAYSDGAGALADDLGAFRLYALPPGEYYVVARAANGPPVYPPSNGDAPRQPVTTFYPNVTDVASAQPIRIVAGEERPPITITLGAGRPSRISGRVVRATGEPLGEGFVALEFADGLGLYSGVSGGAGVRRDGTFETSLLAPGQYRLRVTQARGAAAEDTGSAIVNVEAADVTDVVIVTRKVVPLRGRVTVDARQPARLTGRDVVVHLARTDETLGPFFRTAVVKDDWSFEAHVAPGKYTLSASTRSGDAWTLADILLGTQSVAWQPIDVDPERGVSGLELILTNATRELRGRLTSRDGAPVSDAWVVLFPRDLRHWNGRSPLVAGVQPDATGEFTFARVLPSDDYLIVAVPGGMLEQEQWRDPATLQMLRPRARSLTITASGENVVNLRVEP